MNETLHHALDSIPDSMLIECERVRTAGLLKKQEPKIFRIFEPIGITVMVAAVLAVLIVAPDFLKRKPMGAASGTDTTAAESGTNTDEIEIPQPSEDLLRQIEEDYTIYRMQSGHYDPETDGTISIRNYYGTFNQCVPIMFDLPQTGMIRDEVVAGAVFHYAGGNSILIWCGGQFLSINAAYEQGVLTKEDVSILADRHNTGTYWSRYEGENPEPDISDIQILQPSEDLLRQIEEDYMDHLKTDKYYPVMNYYGSYNGAEVVRMSVPAYMAIFGEMVAGYTFTYGDSNSIKVWKDGMFFTLNEAYEQGVLTKEDISILAKTHVEGKFIDFRPFEGELR